MQLADKLTVPMRKARGTDRPVTLLAVVAISDFLIFDHTPGLNLFLFSLAVAAAILWSAKGRISAKKAALHLAFVALACAPLLEAPTPMGMAVSIGMLICVALIGARLMPQYLSNLPIVMLRFILAAPLRLFRDCRKHLARPAQRSSFANITRNFRSWIVPLVLAAIFLALFTMANPLIENALRSIDLAFLLQFMDIWRIGFWLAIAVFVWAMLRPRLKRLAFRAKAGTPEAPAPENSFLNHASLLRSLVVFNALFAIQTALDVIYLWGGAELPDGMSHAEYAHRGAYPLIATALLAAAFVLIAMRSDGPGDRSNAIRGLVLVWIGQNILLCLSSILRLDLYVEVYSLTELRIAAGIWMGLVAIGLVLILMRIALRKSNQWLISMNVAALAGVLYISAFVDLPAFIARFNVEHSFELTKEGVPLDIRYLSSLGPSVIPALDTYLAALPADTTEKTLRVQRTRQLLAYIAEARSDDWRSWSLRAERIKSYLRASATIAR